MKDTPLLAPFFSKKLKVNRSMGIFQNIETSKPKK
jgi:hypothetical protein